MMFSYCTPTIHIAALQTQQYLHRKLTVL
uniref:Uncharacterized protein n=1 Tax=Anguilla anguilla TaxID=7936 RepID=A0A0E9W6Y0_ANGAN